MGSRFRVTDWAGGACAAAVGVASLLGFAMREVAWVRLEIGMGTAIALNTAISLTLGGGALLLAEGHRNQKWTSGLGWVLAVLASGVLLEHLLGRNLGLDAVRLHRWLGPSATPGRMAPTTCAALLSFGVALVLLPRASSRVPALAIRVLALITVAIGGAGLLGYILQFDALYTYTAATRMAPQTAVGLTALGLGLWQRRRRLPGNLPAKSAEAGGIVSTATASLLIVGAITGLGGLYLMQRLAQEAAVQELESRRDHAILFIRGAIQQRLDQSLALAKQWDTLAFPPGFSGVALFDERGRVLAQAGQFQSQPQALFPIDLPGDPQLLWQDGYWLRLEQPARAASGIARVRLEAPLPLLDQLNIADAGGLGLCGLHQGVVSCFPSGPAEQPFTLGAWRNGKPWSLAEAMPAPPGWIQSTDHRGERVLAAYGAAGSTGLLVVQKRNLDALYAPVRRRFEYILPLLACLILLAVAAMRSQVRPLELRLTTLARNDALTGLANRTAFLERLEQAVAAVQRDPERGSVALLYLDIDQFKTVNDTLGHAAGDRLLRDVAGRIAGCVRTGDTVARLGGDEFTVLLEGLRHADDAERAANAIRRSLDAPFELAGQPRKVTASIGVAYGQSGAVSFDAEALLQHADAALYEVKRRGRDGILLSRAAPI